MVTARRDGTRLSMVSSARSAADVKKKFVQTWITSKIFLASTHVGSSNGQESTIVCFCGRRAWPVAAQLPKTHLSVAGFRPWVRSNFLTCKQKHGSNGVRLAGDLWPYWPDSAEILQLGWASEWRSPCGGRKDDDHDEDESKETWNKGRKKQTSGGMTMTPAACSSLKLLAAGVLWIGVLCLCVVGFMSLESDKRVLAANLTHPLLNKIVCFALHSTPFKSIDSSSQPSSLQRPSASSFPTHSLSESRPLSL